MSVSKGERLKKAFSRRDIFRQREDDRHFRESKRSEVQFRSAGLSSRLLHRRYLILAIPDGERIIDFSGAIKKFELRGDIPRWREARGWERKEGTITMAQLLEAPTLIQFDPDYREIDHQSRYPASLNSPGENGNGVDETHQS